MVAIVAARTEVSREERYTTVQSYTNGEAAAVIATSTVRAQQ